MHAYSHIKHIGVYVCVYVFLCVWGGWCDCFVIHMNNDQNYKVKILKTEKIILANEHILELVPAFDYISAFKIKIMKITISA